MKIFASESDILGAVAYWAIKQSPYYRPDNLQLVLDQLHIHVGQYFADADLGFAEFENLGALVSFISENLRKIPEYRIWNERKNGNDAPLQFTSRYDGPGDPDDDFIDLDALERNVARTIEDAHKEAQR